MQHLNLWIKGSMCEAQKALKAHGIPWKSCVASKQKGFPEVTALVERNASVDKIVSEWFEENTVAPFPPGTLLNYSNSV